MFNLAEEVYLYGKIVLKNNTKFALPYEYNYGIVGAILIELLQSKKISLINSKINVIYDGKTSVPAFDRVLAQISRSPKLLGATEWILTLERSAAKLKLDLQSDLVKNGMLIKSSPNSLNMLQFNQYSINPDCKEIYNGTLSDNANSSDSRFVLFRILSACGTEQIRGKQNNETFRTNNEDHEILEVIDSIRFAIISSKAI